MKVNHKDSPKIEGTIMTEPEKLGNNFTVHVHWESPRTIKPNWLPVTEEFCFITNLIHETINFMAWRDEKLNES